MTARHRGWSPLSHQIHCQRCGTKTRTGAYAQPESRPPLPALCPHCIADVLGLLALNPAQQKWLRAHPRRRKPSHQGTMR